MGVYAGLMCKWKCLIGMFLHVFPKLGGALNLSWGPVLLNWASIEVSLLSMYSVVAVFFEQFFPPLQMPPLFGPFSLCLHLTVILELTDNTFMMPFDLFFQVISVSGMIFLGYAMILICTHARNSCELYVNDWLL